jgi:hypothetical protein
MYFIGLETRDLKTDRAARKVMVRHKATVRLLKTG